MGGNRRGNTCLLLQISYTEARRERSFGPGRVGTLWGLREWGLARNRLRAARNGHGEELRQGGGSPLALSSRRGLSIATQTPSISFSGEGDWGECLDRRRRDDCGYGRGPTSGPLHPADCRGAGRHRGAPLPRQRRVAGRRVEGRAERVGVGDPNRDEPCCSNPCFPCRPLLRPPPLRLLPSV